MKKLFVFVMALAIIGTVALSTVCADPRTDEGGGGKHHPEAVIE